MTSYWHLADGFAVSIVGGHIVLWLLVERVLWPRVKKGYRPGTLFRPNGLTWLTSMVERGLYTAALVLGGFQWVGVWLGIKVIARWQTTEDRPKGSMDIWLIGSGLSLVFGFIGACIALGHVPCLK